MGALAELATNKTDWRKHLTNYRWFAILCKGPIVWNEIPLTSVYLVSLPSSVKYQISFTSQYPGEKYILTEVDD